MPRNKKFKTSNVLIRYLLIIVVALFNLWLFYTIFAPLTIYPSYYIIKLFSNVSLSGNVFFINGQTIELTSACIAGAAYYLLFIFNMSVPFIKIKQRIIMILSSFLALLILNISRIVILTMIFISGSSLFDLAHLIFWYVLSTIFVVGIWLVEIKIFKIKEIPIYSDIKILFERIKK